MPIQLFFLKFFCLGKVAWREGLAGLGGKNRLGSTKGAGAALLPAPITVFNPIWWVFQQMNFGLLLRYFVGAAPVCTTGPIDWQSSTAETLSKCAEGESPFNTLGISLGRSSPEVWPLFFSEGSM